MEGKRVSDLSGSWTNERHMHYLSSIEASFVRAMLENHDRLFRLDRHVPDSSESTLDLKRERRRRHSISDIPQRRLRSDKKTRRLSSHPYTSSQDQVVPQCQIGRVDKDGGENADVPATSGAPEN
ncbi:hypothetical protein NMG60_11018137 [Bertholletia excelsa]